MFKVGEKVIHSYYGLCEIASIESVATDQNKKECYVIYIKGAKIMIPIANTNMLRYPIKKEGIPKVLGVLGSVGELPNELPSKERMKLYAEKLESNDILKVAGVLRGLAFLDEIDKLKGRERVWFERINKILSAEISLVRNISNSKAQKFINNCLENVRKQAKRRRKSKKSVLNV